MAISDALRDMIFEDLKSDEGFSPRVYEDILGNATIGYGHKLTGGDNFEQGSRISPEDARDLLRADMERAIGGFVRLFPNHESLPARVKRGLINMVFQMGEGGVAGFENMRAAIDEGDYGAAARHALDSRWAREQTPNRAARVAKYLRQGALDLENGMSFSHKVANREQKVANVQNED